MPSTGSIPKPETLNHAGLGSRVGPRTQQEFGIAGPGGAFMTYFLEGS